MKEILQGAQAGKKEEKGRNSMPEGKNEKGGAGEKEGAKAKK